MINSPILRFLVSGGSAAALEYLVFFALNDELGETHLHLSQSLSFGCGFVLSFFLARSWVFRSGGSWFVELGKYLCLATINLAFGNLLISLLTRVVGLDPLLAKFFVMAAVAVWNYVIASKLIFRTARPR